ncbi:MFS general substrate transporter [Thozetella sp. PMI_491]|nr:MFS general substrate transporter [Thozetella sp. PMI_491]
MSDLDAHNVPVNSHEHPVQKDEIADPEPDAQSSEPSPEGVLNEKPTRQIRGFRWLIICVAIYITCFLYGLDTTIAADVQGPVVEAFGHVEQLTWLGAGFPLGSVATVLPAGALYNMFNTRWIFIVSVITFEAGSALCGGAPNMDALIVGRLIAGAGGNGIYLGSLYYYALLTTPEERGLYMALIGFWWGVGAILGPVIGGAFAVSAATWRWAFYINLVLGAVAAPAYLLYLPSHHPIRGVSIKKRLALLDWVGFVLGAGVWTSFLLALTMAGGQWPWKDGRTIATFVVFGVVLVLYAIQQGVPLFTTVDNRSYPVHLLRQRTQVLLYITTAAGITSLYVTVYFIPLYFQFVNGDSALIAAVRLLPFLIVCITVNLASGYLLSTIKIYMLMYTISSIFITTGGALLMVYLHPETPTGTIYGLMVVLALGTGLAMLSGFAVTTLTLDPQDAGNGLALQSIAQIGAQVIALAIAGQVFRSTASRNLSSVLAGKGFSDNDISSAIAGASSDLFNQLEGELRLEAISAITQAMQATFVLVPVAGAVMLLAGLCMKREKLFGHAVVVGG